MVTEPRAWELEGTPWRIITDASPSLGQVKGLSSASLYQHPLPCMGSFSILCQIPSRIHTKGECLGNSLTCLVLSLSQLPRGDGLILTILTGSRQDQKE